LSIVLASGTVQVIANFWIEARKLRFEELEKERLVKDRIRKAEQAVLDGHLIYEHLNNLRNEIGLDHIIGIYAIHNHGGVPATGESRQITLLFETHSTPADFSKSDWIGRELFEGFNWFYAQVLRYGIYYVEDVQEYSSLYKSETAEYLNYIGTGAILAVHLKSTPSATLYLSIEFPESYPDRTDPNLNMKVLNAAQRIRPLLTTHENLIYE